MQKFKTLPAIVGNDVLDDCVNGVFFIEAKSRNTFFNRKQKIKYITGFYDWFFYYQ